MTLSISFKNKLIASSILLTLLLVGVKAQAAPIMMPTDTGPIMVDSDNFSNVVVGSSLSSTSLIFGSGVPVSFGPFTIAEAEPFIVGSDLTKGLALGAGPSGGVADFIVPGFGLASIENGAGADFAIWEAGAPAEDFLLSVSTDGGATFSSSLTYTTTSVVPGESTSGFATNIGFVNLDDFGLAAGSLVDAVKVSGLFTGVGGSGPDLLAIAALNAGPGTGNVPGSVPEPGTLLLLALGLFALGLRRQREYS